MTMRKLYSSRIWNLHLVLLLEINKLLLLVKLHLKVPVTWNVKDFSLPLSLYLLLDWIGNLSDQNLWYQISLCQITACLPFHHLHLQVPGLLMVLQKWILILSTPCWCRGTWLATTQVKSNFQLDIQSCYFTSLLGYYQGVQQRNKRKANNTGTSWIVKKGGKIQCVFVSNYQNFICFCHL